MNLFSKNFFFFSWVHAPQYIFWCVPSSLTFPPAFIFRFEANKECERRPARKGKKRNTYELHPYKIPFFFLRGLFYLIKDSNSVPLLTLSLIHFLPSVSTCMRVCVHHSGAFRSCNVKPWRKRKKEKVRFGFSSFNLTASHATYLPYFLGKSKRREVEPPPFSSSYFFLLEGRKTQEFFSYFVFRNISPKMFRKQWDEDKFFF